MSNLLVQTNTTSATVTWNTDELSRVKVFYSTNPIAESEASQSFTEPTIPAQFVTPSYALQTSQSVSLTNLVSKTTYYYIAESIDQSGNVTVSNQSSFTTN